MRKKLVCLRSLAACAPDSVVEQGISTNLHSTTKCLKHLSNFESDEKVRSSNVVEFEFVTSLRQTDTDTVRHTDTQTERQRNTVTHRKTETDRQRQTDRETQTNKQVFTKRDRQKDRDTSEQRIFTSVTSPVVIGQCYASWTST